MRAALLMACLAGLAGEPAWATRAPIVEIISWSAVIDVPCGPTRPGDLGVILELPRQGRTGER